MKVAFWNTLLFILIQSTLSNFSFAQNVALDFDGSNDIVQTTYGGITGSADRTFEAWIFVSSNAPNANLAILDYGLNAVGSRNTFAVSSTRKLTFISGGTNANISSTNTNVVPIAQWTHVAFVLDNGTGYLYVNGVQVGTGSLSTVNTPTGNQDLRIGQRVTGGSIPFEGAIDEVRIYDYARTVTQINADMNAEYCSIPAGLVAYYRLNDGIANAVNTGLNTAIDDIGNNNGTLTNFALSGTTSNWVTGPVLTSGLSNSSILVNTCSSYTSTSGMVYNTSGVYSETLTNSAGCDSIVTINLTIAPLTSSINVSACVSYTSPSGNYVYTGTGLYYDTLQTAGGCDSIIAISFTIDSYAGTEVISACNSYTTPDGLNTWTSSGQNTVTYINVAGCDSVVTYDLTIESSSSATINETACSSYTSPSGNYTFTASGNYMDTIQNTAGCDSVITINLNIINIDNGVSQTGATLQADLAGASYQWYTCNNGMLDMPIPGETGQSYTANATGDYGVEITLNGCIIESACYTVDISSIAESPLNSVKIYPNPSNGTFTISFASIQNQLDIRIVDLSGKEVYRKTRQVSNGLVIHEKLPSGVYFLQLQANNRTAIRKIVVL